MNNWGGKAFPDLVTPAGKTRVPVSSPSQTPYSEASVRGYCTE
jgi:hypothetical protein